MFFYYSIAFFIFSLNFFTKLPSLKKYSNLINYLTFFILVIIIGSRWKMGTDWEPYYNNFINFHFENENFEIGYKFISYLINSFTINYSIFLLIYTFIYLLVLYKAFNKLNLLNTISILLYFTLTLGIWGSHRQLMSISISFYALHFLFKDKNFKFILFVFLASLFHYSALFCLFYFIIKLNFSKYNYLFLFSLIILFGNFFGEIISNNIFGQNGQHNL